MNVQVKVINKEKQNWHTYQSFKVFCLDIETHADNKTVSLASKGDFSRIGAWCGYFMSTIDDENYKDRKYWGHNEEEIIELIDAQFKKENTLCFIFNASFDLSYLLPKLVEKYKLENFDINCKSLLSTIYEVKITYYNHIFIIRDLRLLLGGGSLDSHSKGFNVKHAKLSGTVDYVLDRHTKEGLYEPTDLELLYNYYDVASMLEIIEDYFNKLNTEEHYYGHYFFNSVSAASYSAKLATTYSYGTIAKEDILFNTDTTETNTDEKRRHKSGDIKNKKGSRKVKKYHLMKDDTMKKFRTEYPILQNEVDEFLRIGYHGGLCYPFYKYAQKTIYDKVAHIDAASMYPSQMILNEFPYGNPVKISNDKALQYEKHTLTAAKIKYTFDSCNFIPDIGMTHYIKVWNRAPLEYVETVIWLEIELDVYKNAYKEFEFEIVEAYRFKAKPLTQKEYINKIFNLKKTEKGANRQRYKIVMNSLYGKFGERKHKEEFKLVYEDSFLTTLTEELENPRESKYTYLPIASCATAYARKELTTIMGIVGYENCVYCDTDSIFFVINKTSLKGWEYLKSINKIGKDVGQWEFDGYYIGFSAMCPKKYKGVFVQQKEITDEALLEKCFYDVKYAGCNIYDFTFDISGKDSLYETRKTLKTSKGNLIILGEGEVRKDTFLDNSPEPLQNNLNEKEIEIYNSVLRKEYEKIIISYNGSKKGLDKIKERYKNMEL